MSNILALDGYNVLDTKDNEHRWGAQAPATNKGEIMLSTTYCGIYDNAPMIRAHIEACEAFDANHDPYYRLELGGVLYTLTDEHLRHILDVLSSALPLPKSEPECECHDLAGDVADASGCALHGRRGGSDAQF